VLARFVTEEGHASVLLSGDRWQGLEVPVASLARANTAGTA
jgi:hypothetical protein